MKNDILKFIEKFKAKKGYLPKQAEIATGLDVSKQSIHYHFKGMEKQLKKYPDYRRFFPLTKSKKRVSSR